MESTPDRKTPRPALPRTILVAYDAESMADAAVLQALEVAAAFDARVEVVHAVGTTAWPVELRGDPRDVARGLDPLEIARRTMTERLAALLGPVHGGRARAEEILRVVAGQPAAVLLARAKEIGADWIVLGALRRRPVFDFGSTARAVLARAPGAVWVQPRMALPVRRILVAVDLSRESLRALDTAVALAQRSGASVRALHTFDATPWLADPWGGMAGVVALEDVRRASRDEFAAAMQRVDWCGVPHEIVFEDGPAAPRILDQSRDVDLVVMGTHGRTGLSAAVLGSTAYDVLRASQRPVLVVRDPERAFQDA